MPRNAIETVDPADSGISFKHIVSIPEILGGKPCITGTRISVGFVLELFASGASHREILDAYPHLSAEGVEEAFLQNK